MTDPIQDVAHLGHVEMYTDKFDDSLDFFTRVYGLKLSAIDGESAYLRAWDDYEFCTLKLTRHHTTGVGHIGYRVVSPEALKRRVAAIEASDYEVIGWIDGDLSHGRAFRFQDPFGHVFELYWETNRYEADDADKAALKNMSSRFHAQGACPRRIDHLNLLADDVSVFRDFMQTCLGSRVTEQIQLDNGRLGGCWFTINNKTYDLACTEEHGRGDARLHQQVEVDVDDHLALDQQIGLERQGVDGGVHRALDHVLDGGEPVVDIAPLGGPQHLDDAAELHVVVGGEIGLAEHGLLGERTDRPQVADGGRRCCGGVHEQRG